MTLVIILAAAVLVGAIYLVVKAQAHKKSLTISNLVEEVKAVETEIKAESQPTKAKAPKKAKPAAEKATPIVEKTTSKKVTKNK